MEQVGHINQVKEQEEHPERQKDELLQLPEEGYVFRNAPQFKRGKNTAFFYFINLFTGETLNKQLEMDEKEFEEVKSELEKKMKELYGFARYDARAKKSEPKKKETKAKTIVETELGRSYASFLRNLANQVDWWTEAMNDIGFFATMTALQLAKVEPQDLYNKIMLFKEDPQSFVAFVKEHFAALLEAKKDAEALMKYRQELGKLAVKLEMVYEIAKKYKRQRDKLLLLYNTAVSVMCNKCKNKFLVSNAIITVGGVEDGESFD